MAKMKEFVIEVCELYQEGFDMPTIAAKVNTSLKMVEYIIQEYYKEFTE